MELGVFLLIGLFIFTALYIFSIWCKIKRDENNKK